MQALEEPSFNQLRTIEQLGYVVYARRTNFRGLSGA
jgi:secreted Zn-dependent insulinase-like peptidase